MPKKRKDTDYLFISTYLRALESRLLTRERRLRMVEARTDEDAAKVLSECGYEGLEPLTAQGLEQSLRQRRDSALAELAELSPNPAIVDVFRIKYDYHNLKAILKCAATGQDPERMLVEAGRISPEKLRDAIGKEEQGALPQALWDAAVQAQEILAATGDPQKSDFSLDRAYFAELMAIAETADSAYLRGYARLLIDSANLRAAVRAIRRKKSPDFLGDVLVTGGNISPEAISAAAVSGDSLEALFSGHLQAAAALGDTACKGGPQTAFERACDDAINAYLQDSRMVPFGDGVLIAYAAALENDVTAARIILSGRMAGVPADSIRERLREAYV